jgi:hypothetical protein
VNKAPRSGLDVGTLTRRLRRHVFEYLCPCDAGHQEHRQGHSHHAQSKGCQYAHRHAVHGFPSFPKGGLILPPSLVS